MQITPPVSASGESVTPDKQSNFNSRSPDVYARYLAATYFPSLNGLRFISAVAVIKEHVLLHVGGLKIFSYGWLGVDMFFVLSGFLIVTLLIREKQKSGRVDLKNFYVRRTLRIFPIYYLLIASVFLFYLAISPRFPNGLKFYAWTFPVLVT